MRKRILKFIDFFYPPFSGWLSLHTFRYLATGGTTAMSGVLIYFVVYNYVLQQQGIRIANTFISGHILALGLESVLSFIIGFMFNKYLIFTESNLKGRIQLFRYATVVCTNLFLNYAFMKVLVDTFYVYPTIAKAIITVILALFSYFSQKYFTFKVKKQR